ncbi:MAG: flagellar hook-length control protein FliK [Chitinispirillales bacterium]|jgi:flagellar hook-length control protein FliK|nr:flagellar hook-length control protein FliK [Chitinispirillales bacterium]
MIRNAETTNGSGFFEPAAEGRTVNSARSFKTTERKITEKNEKFEKTFDSVYRENNAVPKKTVVKQKQKANFTEDKNVAERNADYNTDKTGVEQNKNLAVRKVITENKFEFEIEDEMKTVETENINSLIAQINFENMQNFDIDIRLNAVENIENILAAVSQKLNLNIDTQIPIAQFDAEDVPEEVIWQLSQLLCVLKEMGDAFLDAGLNGETVENRGEIFSPQEAFSIGQYLQQETIKLELSFAELGISREIAKNITYDDMNLEANVSLNVAADLETRTPAQQNLPESVENIFVEKKTGSADIQSIIEQFEDVINKVGATPLKNENLSKEPAITALNELKKEILKEPVISVNEKTAENVEKPKVNAAVENLPKEPIAAVSSELRKEIAKEEVKTQILAENTETAEETSQKPVVKNTLKTEIGRNEADTEKPEEKGETKESKLSEVLFNKNNKKENHNEDNRQNQQKQIGAMENTFSSPIRDAMIRTDERSANSPITLDGVSIEANKFNDSSEITSVSPRFVKLFEKEIVEQVQRTILNSSNKNGVHQISLTLNPEKLGEIKLTIQVDGNVVSAKLNVENSQVKQIIEQNLQNLKDSLAQHNLSAGSLDVNINGKEESRQDYERIINSKNRAGQTDAEGAVLDNAEEFLGMETGRRFGTNSFEFFA